MGTTTRGLEIYLWREEGRRGGGGGGGYERERERMEEVSPACLLAD